MNSIPKDPKLAYAEGVYDAVKGFRNRSKGVLRDKETDIVRGLKTLKREMGGYKGKTLRFRYEYELGLLHGVRILLRWKK